MNFFKDKKKIKATIEEYVYDLGLDLYSGYSLLGACSYYGIDLIAPASIYTAKAFKFESGKLGIIIHLDHSLYIAAQKISHHLLRHFERDIPIYQVEAESHYFASAVSGLSFWGSFWENLGHVPISTLLITNRTIKSFLQKEYHTIEQISLL